MNIEDLLRKLQETSLGQQMTQYLNQRGGLPEIKHAPSKNGETASFTYGDGVPPQGRVDLTKNADLASLIHELTHASDRQITKQWYQPGMKEENPQFYDAYEKMRFREGGGFSQKFPGGEAWFKDNWNYRARPDEARAHATGNMYDPHPNKGPSHLDPTLATEMEILLELAKRNQK